MASPASITKRRKTQSPAPGTGSPEHSRRVFGGREPERVTHPLVLARDEFFLSKGMVLALGGFIHSTQVFKLVSWVGFGFNSEEDSEEASGRHRECAKRIILPWERWCAGRFFFFFFSPRCCCCCNHTFYVFQLKKKAGENNLAWKGSRASQKPGEDFFFFPLVFFSGTLDFLS